MDNDFVKNLTFLIFWRNLCRFCWVIPSRSSLYYYWPAPFHSSPRQTRWMHHCLVYAYIHRMWHHTPGPSSQRTGEIRVELSCVTRNPKSGSNFSRTWDWGIFSVSCSIYPQETLHHLEGRDVFIALENQPALRRASLEGLSSLQATVIGWSSTRNGWQE